MSWLFLRIYKLECILLHNTFPSAKVFSFDIFTLLMFRKPNTTTINKNKTIHFIAIRPFSSRLYLDISRSFKCLKFSPIWSVWFEIDWFFGSVVVFCIARIYLKVHVLISSEHKSYKIWNFCIVYWSITYLNKLLIFFKTKFTMKSYTLIIRYNSVVTVARWLDGSFKS